MWVNTGKREVIGNLVSGLKKLLTFAAATTSTMLGFEKPPSTRPTQGLVGNFPLR
jgi:hypothetical protein